MKFFLLSYHSIILNLRLRLNVRYRVYLIITCHYIFLIKLEKQMFYCKIIRNSYFKICLGFLQNVNIAIMAIM